MYRLTARMQQHLRQDLERYHDLFDAGRGESRSGYWKRDRK